MNYEELMKFLDIEEPREFQYYENVADFLENDQKISDEAIYKLFSQVDFENLKEILDNYFEEMQEFFPEDAIDFFTLINTIHMFLVGMISNCKEENDIVVFVEELIKFRNWYSRDSEVFCKNLKNHDESVITVRDAITLKRLEKLGGDEYRFDFNNCLNYELNEYVISFADLAEQGSVYEEESSARKPSILEDGFVYDDEFNNEFNDKFSDEFEN